MAKYMMTSGDLKQEVKRTDKRFEWHTVWLLFGPYEQMVKIISYSLEHPVIQTQ